MMRSIRRSLLGYLLVLLPLALGGVILLVDQIAQAAILAREQAETRRIQEAFVVRQKEARVDFDARLVAETRSVAQNLRDKFLLLVGQSSRRDPRSTEEPRRGTDPAIRATDEEIKEYQTRAAMLQLGSGLGGWQSVTTACAIDPPPVFSPTPGSRSARPSPWHHRLSPLWSGYDAPRAVQRIEEEIKRLFDAEDHPGLFQFTLVVGFPGQPGNRIVSTVRSTRLAQELPSPSLDSMEPRNPDHEFDIDDVDFASGEKLRRVLRVSGRPPLFFWVWMTPPPAFVPGRLVQRPPDLTIRVYVHHARPYSELMDSLAEERTDVENRLAGVHQESEQELDLLHTRLLTIGGVTFLALVLGGWIIVARGLAPVKKLSNAVSQVSEKDFRLPVELAEMSRELAPVHRRLTETLDQLREAFAREKQAVADISHELRTPIASLLATIDVSLRKPRTPEQYRTTLEDCRSIAKQLGQLVERIMTLASLDAGTAHTSVTLTDASELAAGCAAVIRPLAEAHGLTLNLEIEEGVEVNTDRDKLREVVMNLLHNAVEYNQPGGRLDFKAGHDGDSVVFEVRDTGIGIPPELRERIFERFYRADSSRHATGVHAGLGLAIVKEYVQRLNGTIKVESEQDIGSCFIVRLPGKGPDLIVNSGSREHRSAESEPSAKNSDLKHRVLDEAMPTGS